MLDNLSAFEDLFLEKRPDQGWKKDSYQESEYATNLL